MFHRKSFDLGLGRQHQAVAQRRLRDQLDVIREHVIVAGQQGTGARRAYHRNRSARPGTYRDTGPVTRGAGDAHRVVEHRVVYPQVGHQSLDRHQLGGIGDGLHRIHIETVSHLPTRGPCHQRKLIALRRAEPREDLLSALVQAEEAGDKLSEDELTAMLFLLLVAGHETTVNLIASGTLALLQHPEQLELLRRNPAVIHSAVEELLRFVAPVDLSTERYARADVTLHGVTIPRGALTFAVIISANRDESHFTEPDRLDLRREPNRHLAFGQGVHYCLGAPLARLEAQIAFPLLWERLPRLQLAVPIEKLRWRKSLVLRGLVALPVTY